ncbi:hypothetical protein NQ318_019882 [Aromia moschata]|uniref:UDP-glucuronosyltransferase n=1 Tax=Aromia moschata TaxID=1265417 RepID=A0AAV8YLX5_9CUCU|nr:hypothetical protein NQ318_019882 [Aromia moschata]
MNRYALFLLGVSSIGLRYASCGNILLASEVLSPSHQIWNYALAEGLMAKGHNVTMLGPFADRGNSSDKYHPLLLEGYLDLLLQNEDLDLKSFSDLQPIPFMRALINYSLKVCNHSYHTRGFKTLLSYPRDFRFDLIIIEVTQNACLYPLIQRFGYPPSIAATAFLLPPYAAANFGNQLYTSYLPAYFSDYGGDMGFLQRLANHVFTYADATVRWDYEMQTIEKMARRVFGEDMDSMARLMRHMTVMLCNLDPVVTHPQPLPPNIVPVGGLHVKRAKKLPGNLLAIMENSKNGVILFSLGTNIQSANLGRKTLRALLDAFSKLKLTVLWKFETELNVTLPKNVIVRKWLPQNDILGHRNTKLFISHCGALGTYEAVYHGVPMVGMPFFADQKNNRQQFGR